MKNTTLLLSFFLSLFFYTIGVAQTDNKVKIIGCWEVRQVIFTKPFEGSDEISMEALGTIVCFDKEGKFTNKKSNVINAGNYKVSEDGKTINQNAQSNSPAQDNVIIEDVPGKIMFLSDAELQIQAEEMILYFRKSN